jgi:hypothetical protein
MAVMQEFVAIPMEGGFRVYGVPDFPVGKMAIGQHSLKLHVEGPVWVRPPRVELTPAQWERWLVQLREAGWLVEVGPFWTTDLNREIKPEELIPWEVVRDELLSSIH